jgi:hypothetical protein
MEDDWILRFEYFSDTGGLFFRAAKIIKKNWLFTVLFLCGPFALQKVKLTLWPNIS